METKEPKEVRNVRRILQKPPAKRSGDELRKLAASLSNVAFFQRLDPGVRQQCCRVLKYEFRAQGETVFEEGDEGSHFYVVLSGSVGVFIRDVAVDEAGHEADKLAEEQREKRDRQRKADEETARLESKYDQTIVNRHNVLKHAPSSAIAKSSSTSSLSLSNMSKKFGGGRGRDKNMMDDDDSSMASNDEAHPLQRENTDQSEEGLPRINIEVNAAQQPVSRAATGATIDAVAIPIPEVPQSSQQQTGAKTATEEFEDGDMASAPSVNVQAVDGTEQLSSMQTSLQVAGLLDGAHSQNSSGVTVPSQDRMHMRRSTTFGRLQLNEAPLTTLKKHKAPTLNIDLDDKDDGEDDYEFFGSPKASGQGSAHLDLKGDAMEAAVSNSRRGSKENVEQHMKKAENKLDTDETLKHAASTLKTKVPLTPTKGPLSPSKGLLSAGEGNGPRSSFLRQKVTMWKQVATLPTGAAFGEVALQTDQPRSATIKTMEATHFVTLERSDYSRVLRKYLEQQQQERLKFLSRVPLFADWTEAERSKISFLLQHKHFKRSEVVYESDSPVLEIFIVKEGEFAIQKKLDSVALGAKGSQREMLQDPVEASKESKVAEQQKDKKKREWVTVGLAAAPQMFGFTAYMQGEKNHHDQVVCHSIEGDVYCILCNKLISRLRPDQRQRMLNYARSVDKFYANQSSVIQQLMYHSKAAILSQPLWARGSRRHHPESPDTKKKPKPKSVGASFCNIYTPEGRLKAILSAFPKQTKEAEFRGEISKALKRSSIVVPVAAPADTDSPFGGNQLGEKLVTHLRPCWHMQGVAKLPRQELAEWKPQLKDLSCEAADNVSQAPQNQTSQPPTSEVPVAHPSSPGYEKPSSRERAPSPKLTKMFCGSREEVFRAKDIQEMPSESQDAEAVQERLVENIQERLVKARALHADNHAQLRALRIEEPKRRLPPNPFAKKGGLRGDRESPRESGSPGNLAQSPTAKKCPSTMSCGTALPDPKVTLWTLPDLRLKLHKLPDSRVLGPLTEPSPRNGSSNSPRESIGVSLPILPTIPHGPPPVLASSDKDANEDAPPPLEMSADEVKQAESMVPESLAEGSSKEGDEGLLVVEEDVDEVDVEPYEHELTALVDAIPHHWHATAALVEGYLDAGASCQHKPHLLKVALETSHGLVRKTSQGIPVLQSKVEFSKKTPREAEVDPGTPNQNKVLFSSQVVSPRGLVIALDTTSVYKSKAKPTHTKGWCSPASTAASWRSAGDTHEKHVTGYESATLSTRSSWRSLHASHSGKSFPS